MIWVIYSWNWIINNSLGGNFHPSIGMLHWLQSYFWVCAEHFFQDSTLPRSQSHMMLRPVRFAWWLGECDMQVRSFYSGGQNIPFVCRRCLIRFCKLACLLYLIILLPLFWMKQRGYLITRTQFRYDLHSNYTSDPNTSYGAFLDGLVISLALKNLVKIKWDKVWQTFLKF